MAQGLTDMTRANEFRERPEEALKSPSLAAYGQLVRDVGWQCPACKRTYNPLVPSCTFCGRAGGTPE